MNKFVSRSVPLLILCSLLVTLPKINIVEAEPRTIVVPDDYPTISSAIGNATDGDTIFVKKGTYEGPINETLIIDKTISLIGEDAKDTKINLHPPLVPMNIFTYTYMGYSASIKIEANYVKISGFTIDTPGGSISTTGDVIQIMGNIVATGLSVSGSYATIAENILKGGISLSGPYHNITKNTMNSIRCRGSYNNIAANKIVGFSVEGLVRLEGSFNTVYGNTIIADGWCGINLRLNVSGNIIAKNNITGCTGVQIEWGSNNIVYSNRITKGASGLALYMGDNNTFYANNIVNNFLGALIGRRGQRRSDNNTLYHNNFINNTRQVKTAFIVYGTNYFDNGKEGNYWSDYTGRDYNGDGIGDTPYVIDPRRSDRYPLMVPFDIPSIELPELPGAPSVFMVSPENKTYDTPRVPLNFTVSKQTSWIGYSLDGQENVTITENTTLTGLSNGLHTLTVYANFTFWYTGASETIYFTIAQQEPLPITWVVVAIVIIAVVGAAFLIYFRKIKKSKRELGGPHV